MTDENDAGKKEAQQQRAVVPFVEGRGLVPNDLDGMYRLAHIMASSGLMPNGMNKTEQVFVALQLGFELGFTPMQSIQNIAVINNRPVVWGDAQLALVRNSGLLEEFEEREEGEDETFSATCIAHRKGDKKPIARSFSLKKATKAGLMSKDSWKKYPERMCQMRARSWTLRDAFPDVLKGLRTPADIDDTEDSVPTDVVITEEKTASEQEASTQEADNLYGGAPATAGSTTDDGDVVDVELVEGGDAAGSDSIVITKKSDLKQEPKETDAALMKHRALHGSGPAGEKENTQEEKTSQDNEQGASEQKTEEGDPPENKDGHPCWVLGQFKNCRAGTFNTALLPAKWTGFAKYVYTNRETWSETNREQKEVAIKKWVHLYQEAPFLLDGKGNLLPEYHHTDSDSVTGKKGQDDAPPLGDDIPAKKTDSKTLEEGPDSTDLEMERIDLIRDVAKSKILHGGFHKIAVENLLNKAVISTDKTSDLTIEEGTAIMKEINSMVDELNNIKADMKK